MKKSDLFKSRIKRIKHCSEDLSIYTSKELQSYSFLINSIMRKMLAKSYLVLLLVSVFSYAQKDSISYGNKSSVFSLTPLSQEIDKVNGLAFGLGLDSFIGSTSVEKVNGINLEINPATLLYFLFPIHSSFPHEETVVINGLHISTGNIYDGKINGVSLSLLNVNHSVNGFSAFLLGTFVTKQNGFHISVTSNASQKTNGCVVSMINVCEEMKGFQLGFFNQSEALKGVQIGIYNGSKTQSKGLQIGLINNSKHHKGLQIGFWNMNQKRSFPFVNW